MTGHDKFADQPVAFTTAPVTNGHSRRRTYWGDLGVAAAGRYGRQLGRRTSDRRAAECKFRSGATGLVASLVLSVAFRVPFPNIAGLISAAVHVFVVSAQIIAAAVIDDRGLFSASIRPVTILRLVGVAIVLAGVALSQLGAAAQRQTP
jgi:hypothetical protein